jgi:hypothetical protein
MGFVSPKVNKTAKSSIDNGFFSKCVKSDILNPSFVYMNDKRHMQITDILRHFVTDKILLHASRYFSPTYCTKVASEVMLSRTL